MQAAIVPNLQNPAGIQPQSTQTQSELSVPSSKKSFEEMIHEARQQEDNSNNDEKIQKISQVAKDKDEKSVNEEEKLSEKKSVNTAEKIVEKTVQQTAGQKESVEKSVKQPVKDLKNNINTSKVAEKGKKELSSNNKTEVKEKSPEVHSKLSQLLNGVKTENSKTPDTKNEKVKIDVKELDVEQQEAIMAFLNQNNLELNQVLVEKIPSENALELEIKISGNEKLSGRTFKLDKEGKITVHDLRTGNKTEEKEMLSSENKKGLKISEVKFDSDKNAEITLDVASSVQQNVTSSNTQTASSSGSNFQQMLTNQIQNNAADFVKAGNIVLKDKDVGSIKLILKPESLGNVKIDLQISDKNITGRIIVASQEAYNAFKDSVDSLKQAFINSGFESAGLDLSFAGQNNDSNQFAKQNREEAERFTIKRGYGDLSEDAGFEYDEKIIEFSMRNSVNIVA